TIHIPPEAFSGQYYFAALAFSLPTSVARLAPVLAFALLLALVGRPNGVVRWGAVAAVAFELTVLVGFAAPPHVPFTENVPPDLRALAWQDGQPTRALGVGPILEPNTNYFARLPE